MAPGDREFDIVIFGCTGYTGALMVEFLAQNPSMFRGVKVALAARSRDALEALVKKHSLDVPTLVVSASEYSEVLAMCKRTSVVITCVGPYCRYGEPCVRACVEAGTHYVDVTGETPFINAIAGKFHEQAKEKKLVCIPACGFDSIPTDAVANFALETLRGKKTQAANPLVHVRMATALRARAKDSSKKSDRSLSHGTFQTIVYGLGGGAPWTRAFSVDPAIALSDEAKSVLKREVSKTSLHFDEKLKTYCFPWEVISDPYVVKRTLALTKASSGCTFEYEHYLSVKGWFQGVMMMVMFSIFAILCKFGPTRSWVSGFVKPGQGPNSETRENTYQELTTAATGYEAFYGSHHRRKLRTCADAKVRVVVPNGYSFTAGSAMLSALHILKGEFDVNASGQQYGIVTPVAALGSSLQKSLSDAGLLKLEVVE
eukprot:Rmarinus@m.23275